MVGSHRACPPQHGQARRMLPTPTVPSAGNLAPDHAPASPDERLRREWLGQSIRPGEQYGIYQERIPDQNESFL
jgi:hypothetical protein